MKNKLNVILYTILALNILAVLLYEYQYFFLREKVELPTINAEDLPNINGNIIPYDSYTPIGYGYHLQGIIVKNLDGNSKDITQNLKNNKFILLCKGDASNNINVEQLTYIVELKKAFLQRNIEFTFIYIGQFENLDRENLREMQKRHGVYFTEEKYETVSGYFKISKWADDIFFLLDERNMVLAAGKAFPIKTMNLIINREVK